MILTSTLVAAVAAVVVVVAVTAVAVAAVVVVGRVDPHDDSILTSTLPDYMLLHDIVVS